LKSDPPFAEERYAEPAELSLELCIVAELDMPGSSRVGSDAERKLERALPLPRNVSSEGLLLASVLLAPAGIKLMVGLEGLSGSCSKGFLLLGTGGTSHWFKSANRARATSGFRGGLLIPGLFIVLDPEVQE
jgi:hypothetical protein